MNWLLQEYPECFKEMNSSDTYSWLTKTINKALEYGIDCEFETTQLVLIYLLLGTNASKQHSWFEATLSNPELHATGKLRILFDHIKKEGIPGIERINWMTEVLGEE